MKMSLRVSLLILFSGTSLSVGASTAAFGATVPWVSTDCKSKLEFRPEMKVKGRSVQPGYPGHREFPKEMRTDQLEESVTYFPFLFELVIDEIPILKNFSWEIQESEIPGEKNAVATAFTGEYQKAKYQVT